MMMMMLIYVSIEDLGPKSDKVLTGDRSVVSTKSTEWWILRSLMNKNLLPVVLLFEYSIIEITLTLKLSTG